MTGTVAGAIFPGDRTRLSTGGLGNEPIIVETRGGQVFRLGGTVYLRVAEGALLTL